MAASILLTHGTVLVHSENEHVTATKADVLIEGNRISKIGKVAQRPDSQVIDCMNKIISPGFVDTHHHVWQTQLKGRHANHTLLEYFPSGNFTSSLFSSEDMFWGQMGGCLEMLDCGTTTVVDYAHLNYSPDNNHKAISATVSSGIRSIFCYCPNPRLTSWEPFSIDSQGALGGHAMPTLEQLAKTSPFGDGRITLGFAFDGFPYLPKEYLDMLMSKLHELEIPLISLHYVPGPAMGTTSIPAILEERGYLDDRFLMAHSSDIPKSDFDLYRKRGVHISTTPSTELQMAMGFPVPAFRDDVDATDLCSLGVDCHSNNSSYIPSEARLALQSARAFRAKQFVDTGKTPKSVGYTVEEAFNQATVRGARAAKMGDKVGSIAEGKLADLVIFDATSPSMVCAAEHDPVAAIILHSSPADVDTVIVDGVIRKEGGKLVPVGLDDEGKEVAGQGSLEWKDVARELVRSRAALQEKIDGVDMEKAEKGVMQAYHVNEGAVVDRI